MDYSDYDEDPEDIWKSDSSNDLGYECPRCGHIPSFWELGQGQCPNQCKRGAFFDY